MSLRAIAYGGGVQSTALVVLAAQGEIDYPLALFSNVGDDSELPATIDYVRDVATPWAAERGVEVVTLQKKFYRGERKGEIETLYGRLTKEGSRSLPIPVRMSNTGAPGTRSCTADFKIRVIARELKGRGASAETPATVAIGISTDEFHRASNRKVEPHEDVVYPLLDLGLSRQDCGNIIHRAGLPVPPKSSCYFCPFHKPSHWAELRRDEPELFEKSVDLERLLNERRTTIGKDPVWFTRYLRPLDEAIPVAQPSLFAGEDWLDESGECDDGYCFI